MSRRLLIGSQTASAAQVFLIAMAFYPEVQKKAQAEIETVVGLGRLPDFGDGEHLPYIRAVMMEVLRWKPVVPFDTPHAVMEDDEYRGMFIPKGTIVIAVSLVKSSPCMSLTDSESLILLAA